MVEKPEVRDCTGGLHVETAGKCSSSDAPFPMLALNCEAVPHASRGQSTLDGPVLLIRRGRRGRLVRGFDVELGLRCLRVPCVSYAAFLRLPLNPEPQHPNPWNPSPTRLPCECPVYSAGGFDRSVNQLTIYFYFRTSPGLVIVIPVIARMIAFGPQSIAAPARPSWSAAHSSAPRREPRTAPPGHRRARACHSPAR